MIYKVIPKWLHVYLELGAFFSTSKIREFGGALSSLYPTVVGWSSVFRSLISYCLLRIKILQVSLG